MSDHARAEVRWWPFGVALVFGNLAAPLEAALQIRVGAEFQVNTSTLSEQEDPDVAVDEVGDFVVVWDSQGGGIAGIAGQRFDSAGQRQGGERHD